MATKIGCRGPFKRVEGASPRSRQDGYGQKVYGSHGKIFKSSITDPMHWNTGWTSLRVVVFAPLVFVVVSRRLNKECGGRGSRGGCVR